jgi:5-methylcytosine-specific restriction endonuclease McrA
MKSSPATLAWHARNYKNNKVEFIAKSKKCRMERKKNRPFEWLMMNRRGGWRLKYGIEESDVCEMVYRQGHKCRGCGRYIDAVSCSIDHVTPKSRGGKTAVSNFQLLCVLCNFIKRDMEMAEFIEVCKKVAEYHNGR